MFTIRHPATLMCIASLKIIIIMVYVQQTAAPLLVVYVDNSPSLLLHCQLKLKALIYDNTSCYLSEIVNRQK